MNSLDHHAIVFMKSNQLDILPSFFCFYWEKLEENSC